MKRWILAAVSAAALAGCAASATPIIVYVTPVPSAAATTATLTHPASPSASSTATPRPAVPTPTVIPITKATCDAVGMAFDSASGYCVATPEPVHVYTVKGTQSRGNTKPFILPDGDYEITVKGKAGAYGGNLAFTLYGALDHDYIDLLFNEIVDDNKSFKFTTNEYELAEQMYYFDVLAPGKNWTVTFTLQ